MVTIRISVEDVDAAQQGETVFLPAFEGGIWVLAYRAGALWLRKMEEDVILGLQEDKEERGQSPAAS